MPRRRSSDRPSPQAQLEIRSQEAVRALAELSDSTDPDRAQSALEAARAAFRDAERLAAQARRYRLQVARAEQAEAVDMPGVVTSNFILWRRLSGWSQARLGEGMNRLGHNWNRVTVAEIENGSRKISLDELVSLAGLYSTPLVTFLKIPPGYAYRTTSGQVLHRNAANPLIAGEHPPTVWDPLFPPATEITLPWLDANDWRPSKDIAVRAFDERGVGEQARTILEDELGLEASRPEWLPSGTRRDPEVSRPTTAP